MNTINRARAKTTALRAAAGIATLALLAGCSSQPTEEANNAATISISDAWVKSAESGMSAAFGTLHNDASANVTIVSVSSAASSMLELHETSADGSGQMVMREVEGGFVVPAGGSLDLTPGGNHIMLMDIAAPLVAGEEVEFTLTFADASTLDFVAVVKDFAGANETYQHDDGHDH